jgi:hypothetical protein
MVRYLNQQPHYPLEVRARYFFALLRGTTAEEEAFLKAMDTVYTDRKPKKMLRETFMLHWFVVPEKRVANDVGRWRAESFNGFDKVYVYRKKRKPPNMRLPYYQRIAWELGHD